MKFLDDMIVAFARRVLGAVMAIGTGLVYVQFLALSFLGVTAGVVLLAVIITALFRG